MLLNLLFQADQLLLRRFSADAALRAGLELTAADPLVGAYRATQLFCFLPYQLVISVSIVLFPMLARAHRDADGVALARYVRQGVRLALIGAGLIVSVTCTFAVTCPVTFTFGVNGLHCVLLMTPFASTENAWLLKPAPPDSLALPVNAPINPQDMIPAPRLVAIAYGFIWVMLFGYVWSVRSRLTRVEREIDAVSRRVPERK